MIKIVGQDTGKVYAEGNKTDCFRKLHKQYPSLQDHHHFVNKGVNKTVYPEVLLVVKK